LEVGSEIFALMTVCCSILFQAFLDKRRADMGSAVDSVQQGLDKLAANIKWRNRFLAQVQDWLAREVKKGEAAASANQVGGEEERTADQEKGGYFDDFVSGRMLCPMDVLGLFCE
jgi:hypothetical protein